MLKLAEGPLGRVCIVTCQTCSDASDASHRTPDHAPPAQKAAHAAMTVTSPDDASAGVPAVTLELRRLPITNYSAGVAATPAVCRANP